MDLEFRRFAHTASGIAIDIEGLPTLWCHACDLTALPDRSRASIMFAHEAATKAGQARFTSRRRKIEQNFGFTSVPFAYDPDDYFYYPGLAPLRYRLSDAGLPRQAGTGQIRHRSRLCCPVRVSDLWRDRC
jgi:hypothetical protein